MMSSRFGSIFVVVAAMVLACAGVVIAQPAEPGSEQDAGEDLVADASSSLDAGDVVPNSFIVVLDDAADPRAAASELAGALNSDIEITQTYENALKGFAIRAQDLSLSDLRSATSAITGIDFIARDRKVEASKQKKPTGINRIEADQSATAAINRNGGSVNADVAILDTGIDGHRDLNIDGGYNCVGSDRNSYSDGDGHGTHVAGSAAAKDNDRGVVGVAPGARLFAVKVLDRTGSGSFSSVICGIDWVTGKNTDSDTTNDIETANMSLGATVTGSDDGNCGWIGNNSAAAMHRAICNSVAADVFYAVAAGNDSKDFINDVPAAFDEVLTVTAMADFDGKPGSDSISTCRNDQDDSAAEFSNYTTAGSPDEDHTIAAPGVCIRSTWKDGTYNTISGTSMASPHLAGTAALCIAGGDCSGLAPQQILEKLRNDAQQKSDLAVTPYYGFTGDPNRPIGVLYYGHLEFAGDY